MLSIPHRGHRIHAYMVSWIQLLVDRLRGHPLYYQYYATINPSSCEVCLGHHGEIYSHLDQAPRPPLHQGCRCALLEFRKLELECYQERGQRMKEKAQLELHRRKLFRRAIEVLNHSSDEALSLFQQAVQIEIYLEEIEDLCHEKAEALRASPQLALALQDLFLKAFRQKFELDKYKPMPEGMKSAQLAYGLQVIRELFQEYAKDPGGA